MTLLRRNSTKILLFCLMILIIVHLFIIISYLYKHQSAERTIMRNQLVQEAMNVIHIMRATAPAKISKALATVNEPYLGISVSHKALYHQHVGRLNYWQINKLIKSNDDIRFSLKAPANQWVNIKASVTNATIMPQLFLIGFEVIIVSIFLFYLWSIDRFKIPLQEFQRCAKNLGIKELSFNETQYQGPQIVRETAKAMHKMQLRIKSLLDARSLMIAAISHDLRTPLTRLKLRLHKIKDETINKKSLQDITEMETMIVELLDFVKKDQDGESNAMIDLNSLLSSICNEFIDMGKSVVYVGAKTRVPYNAKPMMLKRAFTNLIDNGVKYGKEVCVEIEVASSIKIFINDQGPGIPSDELNQVLKPFYRCEYSRSRKFAGTGLGLSVAQDIIQMHGGVLQLMNRVSGGLTACVVL